MGLRNTDPAAPIVKVTREIPLPWLLGALGLVAIFGVGSYYTQLRHGEQLATLIDDMKKVLAAQDNSKEKLRDVEYEVRELRNRVTALEAKEKP